MEATQLRTRAYTLGSTSQITTTQSRFTMIPLLDGIPPHTFVTALGLSTLISIGSLALAPIAIARLPPDYFVEDQPSQRPPRAIARRPLVHVTLSALKNLLGISLIVAGAAMFVLPGQGLLTMVVGVGLLDFPGKHRLVNALVHRPLVLRSLNWVRAKANTPPFVTEATS